MMKIVIPILLLFIAGLWEGEPTRPEAGTVYHVFYLGGQSNMDGFGYTKDLPDDLKQSLDEVMIFHGNPAPDNVAVDGQGIWATLRPGHGTGFSSDGTTNTYSNRFGLELSFAHAVKARYPDRNIALIKYSRGGTSLDTAATGQFGCWDPDFRGLNGINQYDHFLTTMDNATAVADIDGDGRPDRLIPAGILWMQGESDGAFSADIAEKYEGHLKRLMDLIQAAFRKDDLPVLIGRISDSGNDPDGKVWNHGGIIRSAQASYVEKEPRAALITSTDDYSYSDKWHYDSEGFIDLGRKFAAALEMDD